MKILVDTSVWSEALRRKNVNIKSEDTFIFQLITNNETIILTGIILQEVLTGIKSSKLFNQIENILIDLEYIDPEKEDYIYSAKLKNQLIKKGINAGAIDFLIASVAIKNNLYLATYDKDFKNIAKYSDLKILDLETYLKDKNN